MYQELKEEIKSIIGIVEQCPGQLKERCFEILLNNYLNSTNTNNNCNAGKNLANTDYDTPPQ